MTWMEQQCGQARGDHEELTKIAYAIPFALRIPGRIFFLATLESVKSVVE